MAAADIVEVCRLVLFLAALFVVLGIVREWRLAMAEQEKNGKKGFGRNQWVVIGGSAVVVGSAAVGVGVIEDPERIKVFLDFLADFGKWAIGFAVAGSAVIKTAGLIRNGKKPVG